MAEGFVDRTRHFLHSEAGRGCLLVGAMVLALVAANTPLHRYYDMLIETPVAVQIGALKIAKPLLLWVNDGLMAVFFLLVGLELKKEFIEGEFSDRRQIVLPALGAVGGMVVPAGIYVALNAGDKVGMDGWAIPAATDIAFALGILALVGSRVPPSLKIFLTSLAVFDDVGAIVIIALFYTSKISVGALIVAAFALIHLIAMNRLGVKGKGAYGVMGIIMWVALLKSGVHATLAGVALAMFIPMHGRKAEDASPLKTMEEDLHSAVNFFILPFFAFCNAGISFKGMGINQLFHDVPLGIALGLFFGKQIGVFGFCWVAVKAGWAKLPSAATWRGMYGTAILCGIGFTMSLFIGSLAFEESGLNLFDERLGILAGSFASAIAGYLVHEA